MLLAVDAADEGLLSSVAFRLRVHSKPNCKHVKILVNG